MGALFEKGAKLFPYSTNRAIGGVRWTVSFAGDK